MKVAPLNSTTSSLFLKALNQRDSSHTPQQSSSELEKQPL